MIILQILIIIKGVLCLNSEGNATKQFVLQNEMSEYCRRRVISSVFLGRQVSNAGAQVMHFSRLDLPYSCALSVRTESGSNIILVILSKSELSISSSCSEGHNQLLVYEMGETFGGYWGILPESVFQQEPRNLTTYYTIKTNDPLKETDTNTEPEAYETSNITEEIGSTSTGQDETEDGYVVMEVPLVNVSGNIVFGATESTSSDDAELFDLIYDVTPKNGVLYDTSMLPLAQFSIWKQTGQPEGLGKTEPHYQLDYNVNGFTPDYRLMFRTNKRKMKHFNRRYHSTRRINFRKKNKDLFSVNHPTSRIHPDPEYITKFITPTALTNDEPMDYTPFKKSNDTWQSIERYLKLFSIQSLTTTDLDNEALALLKRISNQKYNASVYLQSNLSNYNDTDIPSMMVEKNSDIIKTVTRLTTTQSFKTFQIRRNDLHDVLRSTHTTNLFNISSMNVGDINTETNLISTKKYSPKMITTASFPSIIEQNNSSGDTTTPVLYSELNSIKGTEKSESGSLVDRESWENIVQIAPAMADLLNVPTTVSLNNTISTKGSNKVIEQKPSQIPVNMPSRKKRYIQALAIDQHRPSQITTNQYASTLEKNNYELDSRDLAEVVELQDDEIHGRVALHYFKNYVGPTVFNICDYTEPKIRQVYLLNSSRIVIAINNFTMDRITLIMTESQVARATGCPPAHLECQVSGVRVCVHKMNACDSVPNCGAYDIYDEERLLCGSTVGFHYTVWLAACTFLMVLLTLLYSVHYWLKRCVPKVSEAFFVYSDKSENILYLDTIMRSPNDFDGGSRLVYHSSFYSDNDISTDSTKEDDGKIVNILKRCLRFLGFKIPNRHSSDIKSQQNTPYSVSVEPKRKFSFTEEELRKIGPLNTRQVSVQTGDSLEINHLQDIDVSVKNKRYSCVGSLILDKDILLQQTDHELTTLRRIRSISLQPSMKKFDFKTSTENSKEYPESLDEEVELRSTIYDRPGKKPGRRILDKTEYQIYSEPLEQKKVAIKHLRFEEGARAIESSAVDPTRDDYNVGVGHKMFVNPNRLANTDLDNIEEDEEEPSTSGRDFRRFWVKGKKNKKKK